LKILFIEWESYGKKDLKEAFKAEGHSLCSFPFTLYADERVVNNPETEKELASVLHREVPDIVFSVDYYPVISKVCNTEHIRYISWIYDSPYRDLYSQTIVNPCNRVYVFDRRIYQEFSSAGVSTVQYLPLAANTERLDGMLNTPDSGDFLYDISFVGSLYMEYEQFYDQMTGRLPDYAKGYLDALIAAQMQIQGYNFVEEVLPPVTDMLCRALPIISLPGGIESKEYLYAQYIINRRVTAVERIDLLDAIAERHVVDVFTHSPEFSMLNICNHGPVDYHTEMPKVFQSSKINLNISVRSIQSGIPLRAFDIMGAGGFLLSNFQPDFMEHFVPGQDMVCYENKRDLVRKVEYYLAHEEERQAIARNGHDKVAAEHTYRHRVREMLNFE